MSNHSASEQEFLDKINELIEDHLENEHYGVSELARELGMSRVNLHRKIKATTKITASQYLRQYRLRKALEMLQQNSDTVSEVAYKTGFSSPSYFVKCFHDYFGFTPGKIETKEEKNSDNVQEKSILVLPFENISPEQDQEYFCDGLTEEIITELSHVEELHVISRSSAMAFKGSKHTISEITEKVNVRYVLEGSVRKSGKILIITTQLIDASDDSHLWAEKYMGTVDDILNFQKNISNSIVENLKQNLETDKQKINNLFTAKEKKPKHNLPAQITSFIGRKKEITEIKELIGNHRLVSITGTAGCGKTRLACEAVSELLSDYKDGIWFVDLSTITDEGMVVKEVAEALSVKEVPEKTVSETVIDKIKDKNVLMILDNCEHVIKGSAGIIGKMLHAAPEVKVLATSRKPLNVQGEKIWKIPSLSLPDIKAEVNISNAQGSEAVQLFTDRAKLNNPEFELVDNNVEDVIKICQKLDGIALALELVASRTRHMDTNKILERITFKLDFIKSSDPGMPARHRTLLSTLDWSYNLLTEEEKLLFARLAVFTGGFDLEAAEEVCSDERVPKENTLDLLSNLVDHSMIFIKKGEDNSLRYNKLVTLRQYAQQKLKAGDEETKIREKHFQYYLSLAEKAYKEQFDRQTEWLNKLELEYDNLIAALNWSKTNSTENYVLLTGYMGWFWKYHTKLLTAIEYLESARSMAVKNTESYARLILGCGLNLFCKGELQAALKLMEESLNLWRKYKNPFEEAIVLKEIGVSYHSVGEFESSINSSKQSLEIARKTNSPGLINHCLAGVCISLTLSKKYDELKLFVEELRISSEKLQQPYGILVVHHLSGDCALGTNNFKKAEREYGLNVSLSLKYDVVAQACYDIQGVAFAVSAQGMYAKAIRLDAAACEKLRLLGYSTSGLWKFWDEWIETYIEGAKKKVGDEPASHYAKEGRAMEFEKVVEYALDFKKD